MTGKIADSFSIFHFSFVIGGIFIGRSPFVADHI